jgi:hypothetical protein
VKHSGASVGGSCVGNTTNYKIEKGGPMRAFVFACIAAAAVAVIGAVVLSSIQQSAVCTENFIRIRAARDADSQRHLASVLREAQRGASIHPNSGAIPVA